MSELRNAYLRTGRDEQVAKRIGRLLTKNDAGITVPATMGPSAEMRGIVVTGAAGAGKTTLIDRALRAHPGLQPERDGDLPVLRVDVPSPATMKSLAVRVIAASGYPEISERKEGWWLWDLARHRFALRNVRCLWLDEAHDLFRSNNDVNVFAVTNVLKSLMKGDAGVSVILSGLEGLEALVRQDDQIARRMSFYRLEPLEMGADDEAVMDVLETKASDAGLGLDASGDLCSRLLACCDGRFGLLVETVTEACELAQDEDLETLDASVFADALADRFGVEPRENHFLAADWRLLPSRFEKLEAPAPRKRGRK